MERLAFTPIDSLIVRGTGLVTAIAAMAGGCSKVIITDIIQQKLDLASRFGMAPVNVRRQNLNDIVSGITDGWRVDVVFEASGSEAAASKVFEPLCSGGRVVFIVSSTLWVKKRACELANEYTYRPAHK